MRSWSAILLLIPLMLLGCQKEQANKPGGSVQGPAEIEVYFSPRGGVTEAVVKELGKARGAVRVQAYSFTSAPIAKALVDARKRGVDVRVILDRSQRTQKYSSADFLVHSDIPTLIDDKHQIAHNKIMIIDGQTVLTGSFNFTKSAEENNAENLLILRNKDLAAKYTQNWDAHAAHSQPYKGRETRVSAGAPWLRCLQPRRWRGEILTGAMAAAACRHVEDTKAAQFIACVPIEDGLDRHTPYVG